MADKQVPIANQVGTGWPSWRYGPGGKSAIFQNANDVPSDWVDNPDKLPTNKRGPKPAGGSPWPKPDDAA